MAGFDRSGDELHVQLLRANQPALSLDNSHPLLQLLLHSRTVLWNFQIISSY